MLELTATDQAMLTGDHGGLTSTKGHGEAKESDNYTIPFYVWGPEPPKDFAVNYEAVG